MLALALPSTCPPPPPPPPPPLRYGSFAAGTGVATASRASRTVKRIAVGMWAVGGRVHLRVSWVVACRHIIVGSLLGGSCVPAWKRPSQKHPSWKDAAARQLSLPIGSYSITLALAPRSSLPHSSPSPLLFHRCGIRKAPARLSRAGSSGSFRSQPPSSAWRWASGGGCVESQGVEAESRLKTPF